MAEYIRLSGVWKTLSAPFIKVAGTWKQASNIYVKSGGVWKTISNPDTETGLSSTSGVTGSSVSVNGDFSQVTVTGVNFGGSAVTFTQTTTAVTFTVPSVGVGTYPVQLITGVVPELAPLNYSVTGTGGGGIGIGVAPAIGIGGIGIGIGPQAPGVALGYIDTGTAIQLQWSTYGSYTVTSFSVGGTLGAYASPSSGSGAGGSAYVYSPYGLAGTLNVTITTNGGGNATSNTVNYTNLHGIGIGIGAPAIINTIINVAPPIINVAPAIIYTPINVGIASLNPPAILILNYGNFCINGDTKVTIVKSDGSFGYKEARDIREGDIVASLRFKEINPDAPAWDIYGWNDKTLTYQNQKPTKVLNVYKSKHAKIMYFNHDTTAKFSEEEPMLVCRAGSYEFYPSGTVDVGDTIFRYNDTYDSIESILVTDIAFEEGDFDTYNYTLEEDHVLVAGGYIVHNK